VLRRYTRSGELDPVRGLQALQDLSDFPLTRYPHGLFLPRIWELRDNVTAYDAVYLALAEGPRGSSRDPGRCPGIRCCPTAPGSN